ncbi:MAG TPA: type IV pilin protein [Steroidobacteraceae bacterium]|nr:type IV pilin protein [Steroidobacteraceae bacterium]
MHKAIPPPAMRGGGRAARGFTLIELVVALIISAILVAIAIPGYSAYVRKGRRTDAKTALLDLASLEERYFSTANVYTQTASQLGYTAFPTTVGGGYYQVQQPVVTLAVAPTSGSPSGTPASFSITANAIGDQLKDTDCLSFTVTSSGLQTASPDPASTCWK